MQPKGTMLRAMFLSSTCLLAVSLTVCGGHDQMISVGERRLSIRCDGEAGSATVVLIAGGRRTAGDWAKVQPAVSSFARVCAYDRAGLGKSDKASKVQSVDEIVYDLHALLKASGEKRPFILVGHSIAGIYVRRFVTTFPGEAAGLVFVDSSHEEGALRLHQLDPKTQGLTQETAQSGYFVKEGERLDWRTELPLIVLARGKPIPRTGQMTEDHYAAWDRIWRELQEDLARRSTHGQLRVAEQSGHFIQREQPELVIQAIRDVYPKRSVAQDRIHNAGNIPKDTAAN
jgi:pimeloyl-ACP methyl ester carboxylesterase